MDLELFIHGVPKGQKIWGKAENDLAYIQNFYAQNNDETKFLVEIRSTKDATFCYYSYLKYNNVVASDGRAGSYFGMTLRFDVYCADIVTIYNILDIVYKKHIVGNLLSGEANKNKFLVADFSNDSAELKEVESTIFSLIRLSVANSDFMNLQSLQAQKEGSLLEVNLLDCTKENILSVMRKCSKVAISPYYPTLKEKNTQKSVKEQMSAFEKSKENEILGLKNAMQQQSQQANIEKSTLVSQAESLQNQIDSLTSDKEKLSASISSLEKEKQALQNKLRSSEERRNASELVASLRDPLTKLAKIVGTSDEEHRHNHYRYEHMEHEHSRKHTVNKMKDFFFPILHTVLLLLIVVYCSFRTYNEMADKKHESVDTEIQNTPTVNEELENIVPNTMTQEAAVAENPSGLKKAKF
ncbi:MAG: hypothetical protein IKY67_12180 [Paludibacteraceae bacterium]|nr:hypothetical protein [Paludibacteraceae bacterium]